MSTITTTFRAHHVSGWKQVKHQFAKWRQLSRSRDDLASLSDAILRDIGLSRAQAAFESSKPFWMP